MATGMAAAKKQYVFCVFCIVLSLHLPSVAQPALYVRRGKVKKPSRFLPFLPDFSPFFPRIFLIGKKRKNREKEGKTLFPDFWHFFSLSGWHSSPLAPPVAMPLPTVIKSPRFTNDDQCKYISVTNIPTLVLLTLLLFIDCSKMAQIRINSRNHTKEKPHLINSYFFSKLVRQKGQQGEQNTCM